MLQWRVQQVLFIPLNYQQYIETIKETENITNSNSKNTYLVSFEAVDQPNKTKSEGEIQIKVKPNNRYCLKSFPRKERTVL